MTATDGVQRSRLQLSYRIIMLLRLNEAFALDEAEGPGV